MSVTVAVSALIAVPAGASVVESASTADECRVEGLPLHSSNPPRQVVVVDADPTGKYIAARDPNTVSNTAGWIWTDGVEKDEVSYFGDFNWLTAVNSSGTAIGYSQAGEVYWRSWKYQDGEISELIVESDDEYDHSDARDINANGDIVGGSADVGTGTPQVVWPSGAVDNPQELPDSNGINAWGISDDGVVIGGNEDGAYMWPDPTSAPRQLDFPADVEPAFDDEYWINGSWAASQAGVRWNLDDGSVEALGATVDSVNSSGDVGSAEAGGIIRADGTVLELPTRNNMVIDNVVVLDEGAAYTAVGTVEGPGGRHARPVTWTC